MPCSCSISYICQWYSVRIRPMAAPPSFRTQVSGRAMTKSTILDLPAAVTGNLHPSPVYLTHNRDSGRCFLADFENNLVSLVPFGLQMVAEVGRIWVYTLVEAENMGHGCQGRFDRICQFLADRNNCPVAADDLAQTKKRLFSNILILRTRKFFDFY